MSQKICIISFDHWNYDHHIVTTLQKKGIDAFHIKIGAYKHKSLSTRITNSLNKIFLGKNPKLIKRQEFILEELKKRGIQDQILVLNPEIIDLKYHLEIKKMTRKYIAYLYDSVDRYSVEHLLDNVFDEIYSFDIKDIERFGFKETSNYNYISNFEKKDNKIEQDVIYIGSFDNRMDILEKLGSLLKSKEISFKFIISGKKATLFKIKNTFTKKYKNLEFRRNRIEQNKLLNIYSKSNTIVDLVRDNQSGLSFRFFEAMALEKKVLTNNKSASSYNFYDFNNIQIIDAKNLSNIDYDFFTKEYKKLPEAIYYEYTLETWVEKIFNL